MSQIPQAEAEQRQRRRCFCASDIRMASGTSSTIDNNVCKYVLCVCVSTLRLPTKLAATPTCLGQQQQQRQRVNCVTRKGEVVAPAIDQPAYR